MTEFTTKGNDFMSTKRENLENPDSCWNKAADDEPVFVLRANDPAASLAVMHWVKITEKMHDDTKRGNALAVARAMDEWRIEQQRVRDESAAKQSHKLLCDLIVDMVAVGESLGFTMRIDPQMASHLNQPGNKPQGIVHVAHVEPDASPGPAMPADQLANTLRGIQNTAQQLLAQVVPNT